MQYPPSKTVPWNHQIEAWKLIEKNPAFYLAHDMGTGKSKTAIDAITAFQPKRVLIICPKKVINVWPDQFSIHSAYDIDVYPFNNDKESVEQKAGRMDSLIRKSNGRPQAFVLNYESCIRQPMGMVTDKYYKIKDPGILLKYSWDFLIVDEAHRIKSPGGKTSWQIFRICRQSKKKLFMSGTPMPHDPLDIYAQYRALNPRIFGTKYVKFKARYAVMGGYLGKQIFEYQNLEDLNRRFYSIAHEVKADDVLDLPPKIDREIFFDLKPSTMRIYKSLEKDLIAEVDSGEITADNVLVKLLRLAQITTGVLKLDDGTEKFIDTSKIERIIDFLEDIPPSAPIAIYYKFTPEGRRLKQELEKTGRTVSMVYGQKDQLKDWQEGKTNTIILQIDAGSEGIDLTRSQYCIYSSTGVKLGVYQQSRKRIHRPGQNQKVFYYHVLARNTVDISNMMALRDKKEVVDFVMRGIEKFKKTLVGPKTKKIRSLALSQILEN